ncbi:MAG: enoyl-CoA hydratase/isomerase family protein [Candidatus Eremiobacteraeota bacterium]|nr:enoyl-CoA hydratase/isomerase family protein [Candidatus Eremiobacteraeota bacterium]
MRGARARRARGRRTLRDERPAHGEPPRTHRGDRSRNGHAAVGALDGTAHRSRHPVRADPQLRPRLQRPAPRRPRVLRRRAASVARAGAPTRLADALLAHAGAARPRRPAARRRLRRRPARSWRRRGRAGRARARRCDGFGVIGVERREGGIAWVVIDRPEARNAMTFAMWERLREVAVELDADPQVRVVVFTGAGGEAFVAGTDIAEFRAFDGADDGVAYEKRIDAVIGALDAIRVPTIAAIAGACTGGGVSIAASCDLRLAARNARIGVPIARTLGNCISVRNVARVGALIGLDAVKALLLTGALLDAEAALRAGFVGELADDVEALHARAHELAASVADLAPLTLRASKEMVRRLRAAAPLPDGEDLVRLCYGSADFREGLTAFLDKRRPHWTALRQAQDDGG